MVPTSFAQLSELKRAQLQALCKQHSLKANGTNASLIDSLAHYYNLAAIPATIDSAEPASSDEQGDKSNKQFATGEAEPELNSRQSELLRSPEQTAAGTALVVNDKSSAPEGQDGQNRLQAQIDSLAATITLMQEDHDNLYSKLVKEADLWQIKLEQATARIVKLESDLEASRFHSISQRDLLRVRIAELEQYREQAQIDGDSAQERASAQYKALLVQQTEGAERVEQLARDINARLVALELDSKQLAKADLVRPAPIAVPKDNFPSGIVNASPTLSDAPPTRSLVNFDSPVGSPAHPPANSHTMRKATPFRLEATGSPIPASAVPSRMVGSIARASPRSPRASAATPARTANIGKRARDSDASNTSVVLETVVSPPRSISGRSIAQSRISMASSKKADGHSTKRFRMSSAESANATSGHEQEEDETDSDAFHDVGAADNSVSQEEDILDEDSDLETTNESIRDYLMPTKTGDSPVTALRPAKQTSIATTDPAFFAAPHSTALSMSARRSTSHVSENSPVSRSASRKSLPVSSLPFPLVSPFANKIRSSGAKVPTTTALGTLSNQPTSAKKSFLPPTTPPASRTLFGTERFPFSDGFDSVSRRDREGSAFEDFETAEEDNNEPDLNWSRFGGAFARV
ncbi:uncharacterized protein JCM15063_001471 [Sporobolomyces koalae]|uniref:uncharacterized protein n=1 Tax=Sporobolomyces koalae TaxID=500713 RepID=UPI0031805AF2